MLSRILPTEELAQRSVMYWLPPGGQDNGVWATMWVVIAELEARQAAPVLARMADADVGAYAAKPSAGGGRAIYVDVLQYNRALDVLMMFLRGKETPEAAAVVRRPSKPAGASTAAPRRARHLAGTALKVACCAALFIGMLALVYLIGATRFPTAQPLPRPPASVPLAP